MPASYSVGLTTLLFPNLTGNRWHRPPSLIEQPRADPTSSQVCSMATEHGVQDKPPVPRPAGLGGSALLTGVDGHRIPRGLRPHATGNDRTRWLRLDGSRRRSSPRGIHLRAPTQDAR